MGHFQALARLFKGRAGCAEDDAAIDAAIRPHFRTPPFASADADPLRDRMLARLVTMPLPPQRKPRFANVLPEAFLTGDFAPAWPRFAALGTAAVLGFAVGSFGIPVTAADSNVAAFVLSSADPDLGAAIFDDDATGVGKR